MEVSFDVKLSPKDLFRFNMYQTYTTLQGPLSIFFTVLVFAMAVLSFQKGYMGYTALYVCGGFAILFYIPCALWSRAKYVLKTNPILAGTLGFRITEKGIDVSQGSETGTLEWSKVYKMVATKNTLFIYSTRVYAYIVPREQLGDKYDDVRKIAERMLTKNRLRMK